MVNCACSSFKSFTKYWRVLKKRLKAEKNETVTKCNALKLLSSDGKMRAEAQEFGLI
jgi:hypothetical protein